MQEKYKKQRRRPYYRKRLKKKIYTTKGSIVAYKRSLFPDRRVVTLNYADLVTLTPVSGNIKSYRFAANGLFDPDITAGGHQPLGFDQLSPFYAKMTVIASTISATFSVASTATNLAYQLGIHRNPNLASVPSSFLTYQENGNVSMKSFQFGSGSNKSPTVKQSFVTKKHMSVKDPLDEPSLASTAAANPTTLCAYDIFCGAADGATTNPALNVNIQIKYVIICSDPIPVASS